MTTTKMAAGMIGNRKIENRKSIFKTVQSLKHFNRVQPLRHLKHVQHLRHLSHVQPLRHLNHVQPLMFQPCAASDFHKTIIDFHRFSQIFSDFRRFSEIFIAFLRFGRPRGQAHMGKGTCRRNWSRNGSRSWSMTASSD